MSHLKSLGFVFLTTLLLVGFQNCSEARFSDATGASSKVVDTGGMDGTEVTDENVDEVVNEIEERDNEGRYVLPEDAELCDSDEDSDDSAKVYMCHFPPGNPAALHTICIGAPAIQAHLNHGHGDDGPSDVLGKCEDLF